MGVDRETVSGTKVYNVKTEIFSGPFDVLLDLIEKRKLFINDIALSQVADDFIAYIQKQGRFPLRESAHFIFVASTLILIKSRSLLPSLDLTEEEEQGIEDLERRLIMYKGVKEKAEELRGIWGENKLFFGSGETIPRSIRFSPDDTITLKNLSITALDLMERLPSDSLIPEVKVSDVIKLENVINSLIRRINAESKISFKSFTGLNRKTMTRKEKYTVIVSFIAVLELVKQGMLTAHQNDGNSDISLENSSIGLPNYT